MHCNVKPPRNGVHETPEQAIGHIFTYGLHVQSHWQDWHFGRDLALIRKATAAIRARDYGAFIASKRRGYWRVELAGERVV